jgi:hypothetical protein
MSARNVDHKDPGRDHAAELDDEHDRVLELAARIGFGNESRIAARVTRA